MILVGLTGGIGSGKSTVSALLAERGAVIVDADAITRDLQQPGSPLVTALAERFGDAILGPDGELDRAALAAIVFNDAEALKALNAIVHPAVGKEIARLVTAETATDHIVILDVPLLTENPRDNLQGKIVVDVPVEVQVERLVKLRGFAEADARARIASQATREDRLRGASIVIDNSGDRDALGPQVDRVWAWLTSLDQLPADFDYTFTNRRSES